MALEIERKYLIDPKKFDKNECIKTHIIQGYLKNSDNLVVRVRIEKYNGVNVWEHSWEEAYLTIKTKQVGITRNEYEYEIPVSDAKKMLKLCGNKIVEKNRYLYFDLIGKNELTIVVDEYLRKNKGLWTAEVEYPNKKVKTLVPEFAIKDITKDNRYKNNNLAINPYSNWKNK